MKATTAIGAALVGAGVIGAGCVAYGTFIEKNHFRLRHLRVPALPTGHSPVRILHLSDLHLTVSQKKKIGWVRGLAGLKPDFIVNTGDNLSCADALGALGRTLDVFSGVPGVFVLGSNDYYGPRPINPLKYLFPSKPSREGETLPTKALIALFTSLGWDNAEHNQLAYDINGTTIEVRGCGDAHMGIDDYPSDLGESTADLLMGVTHAPYRAILDEMVADGANLILTGHTHGGQVCLPGGRALTTNCDLPPSKARGLSIHRYGPGQAYLHVSAGLGTSPYAPYRFACPPEATLLSLEARPEI